MGATKKCYVFTFRGFCVLIKQRLCYFESIFSINISSSSVRVLSSFSPTCVTLHNPAVVMCFNTLTFQKLLFSYLFFLWLMPAKYFIVSKDLLKIYFSSSAKHVSDKTETKKRQPENIVSFI